MNLGCIDRTLATGETSRDLPRRDTSCGDRTVHKTPNIFPIRVHPTPSGVREAFMPACDREVEESHAQSASRSTRGRSAKIRASVVTALFFLCFFSSCIVVVPEGTSPRRRPRSRAIACVRAIRERVRDETILSAERDARGARGALGAPTRVRFFVTRARRDPSTSSRPPRSDARVVSEIRGQIFVFLRFPSIVFDRPRAPPVDEGWFFTSIFYRTRTIFPLSRAREVYSIEDEGSTRAPRLVISHGGNADSLPGISRATRRGEKNRALGLASARERRQHAYLPLRRDFNNNRSPFGPHPRAVRMIRPAAGQKRNEIPILRGSVSRPHFSSPSSPRARSWRPLSCFRRLATRGERDGSSIGGDGA